MEDKTVLHHPTPKLGEGSSLPYRDRKSTRLNSSH